MQAQISDTTVTQVSGSIEPSYIPVFVTTSQTVEESAGLVSIPLTIGETALRDIAINYTVSGTSGSSDHNLVSGTAYIQVGETGTSIQFQVIDDTLDEADESIVVTLAHDSNTHTVTVSGADTLPSVTIGSATGFEGTTIDFPVTLSVASGKDVSFSYAIVHGTTNASDFSGALTGTFTIPAGQTSATLAIATTQDNALDGQETFTVTTSAPVNALSVNSPVTGALNELLVEAIYPVNGSNWNDYVITGWDLACSDQNVPGASLFTSNYLFDWGCPNGGSQRRVKIPAYTTCGNLSLTDSLGVFQWVCKVVNNRVEFNILNFNLGKGLKHLVTEAGFNPIKVQLKDNGGPVIMESALLNGWWTNPVISLPNNTGGAVAVLNTEGAIYVEDTSKNVRGYNIAAKKISVVSGPGVVLTLENSSPNNCNLTTGGTSSPAYPALVCIGSGTKTWVEVDTQLSAIMQVAVYFTNTYFTRVHGTTIKGDTNDWAIYSGNGNALIHISQARISKTSLGYHGAAGLLIIEDTVIDSVAGKGIRHFFGSDVRMSRVRVFNSGSHGIEIDSSTGYGVLVDIVSANNAGDGIFLDPKNYTMANILVANNSGHGIGSDTFFSPYDVSMLNVTAVNNSGVGLRPPNHYDYDFTDFTTVVNSVAGNNGTGLGAGTGSTTVMLHYENLFLGNNGVGISLDNVARVLFNGLLSLGGNGTNCNVTNSGANPEVGITHSTCALNAPSTGTFSSTLNMSASFVGKAGTDSVNTTTGANVNTAIAFASVTDQVGFQNWFRTWGKNGSAYPNSDNRGRCGAGTCNIWDFSLATGDAALRNVNGLFIDGATCPASVQGDNYLSMNNLFWNSYALKFATEILLDGEGDDDGLCESYESCVFSPHAGAYQGNPNGNHLAHSCLFQDGVTEDGVRGVKMYRRPEL